MLQLRPELKKLLSRVVRTGDLCVSCSMAKIVRRKLKSSGADYSVPGAVLATDIFHAPIKSKHNHNYCVLIVDVATGYLVLKYIASLDGDSIAGAVREGISEFTDLGLSVQELKCDNQFDIEPVRQLLQELKIACSPCAPHEHAQNGFAERSGRSVKEHCVAVLHDSRLPQAFWEEIFNAFAYVWNRFPAPSATHSAYEVLYGKKPTTVPLFPMGSLVVAILPPDQQTNLEPRGRSYVLVGYDTKHSASYLLYDTDTKAIVSRLCLNTHVFPLVFPLRGPRVDLTSFIREVELVQRGQQGKEKKEEEKEEEEKKDRGGEQTSRRSTRLRWPTNRFDPAATAAQRRFDAQKTCLSVCLLLDDGDAKVSPPTWVLNVSTPKGYREAISPQHASNWIPSMQEEIDRLLQLGVWDRRSVPLPKGKTAIPLFWVFKDKFDTAGKHTRHKSRLVAAGNRTPTVEGLYSPVATSVAMRLLMVYALQNNLPLEMVDISNAFLYADLEPGEEIYVRPPPGMDLPPGHVLRLRKSIYGLRSSPRRWHRLLSAAITKCGFVPSKSDDCLFLKRNASGDLVALVACHVDDIQMTGVRGELDAFKEHLAALFKLTDLGETEDLLGVHVNYDRQRGTLSLSQRHYTEQLLRAANFLHCKPVDTPAQREPLEPSSVLSKEEILEIRREWTDDYKSRYRTLVGSLMWLSLSTRPDITFAVNQLAKFVQRPGPAHFSALKRVLRYLKGTLDFGLTFRRDTGDKIKKLVGYSDADFGSDLETRRSTTGMVFMMCGGPLIWKSRRQTLVTTSTCEAELVALCDTAKVGVWLRELLGTIDKTTLNRPLVIYEDNSATLMIAKTGIRKSKNKHIDIRYFWIHEKVDASVLDVVKLGTQDMLADIFTKGLPKANFQYLRTLLGVVPISH